MHTIGDMPNEVVARTAQAMEGASAKDVTVEMTRVSARQGELVQFIQDASTELSSEAYQLLASLGVFAYRCFEAWLGESRIPFIPYSVLEETVVVHMEILQEVANADDPDTELAKRFHVRHLPLLRRVGEEVFGPEGRGASLDPGEAHVVFVVVKSIIDTMDQCLDRVKALGFPLAAEPVEGIYQVKVTLQHLRPPVWRRLLVPPDIPLSEFHVVLQIAMGWDDQHLHGFRIRTKRPQRQRRSWVYLEPQDEGMIRLCDVLQREKDAIFYEYDFGDGWEHRIVLEKILPPDPGRAVPVCIKGKRPCPPEDCGGVWRYADLVEAYHDPDRPAHEDAVDWLGPDWDPEAFDLEEVNAGLRACFSDSQDEGAGA